MLLELCSWFAVSDCLKACEHRCEAKSDLSAKLFCIAPKSLTWLCALRTDVVKGVSVRASSRTDASVESASAFASARDNAVKALHAQPQPPSPQSQSQYAGEVSAVVFCTLPGTGRHVHFTCADCLQTGLRLLVSPKRSCAALQQEQGVR